MSKWPMVKLGSLVSIRTGKLDANAADEEGEYPFFTCSVDISRINTAAFDCSAILIAGNGELNVKKYRGKFNAYQRTYVIEPDEKIILLDYLYLFMLLYIEHLREKSIGGVIKYIKLGMLTDALLPLPPLAEQKRIVELLDRAQTLIDRRKEQLSLMDTLIQSLFHEMFGDPMKNEKRWEVKKFTEVCESRLGKMLDKKKGTGKNLKPYLRNANVQWFSFNLHDLSEMDFTKNDQIMFELRTGDILICEGGEPGRAAIWNDSIEECYFQKALHRARIINSQAINQYLVYLFWYLSKNGGLRDYITSATIAHLTGAKLKTLPISLPPLSLQQTFAERVQKIEIEKQRMNASLTELEHAFNSLMQEAFNG